MNTNIIQVDEDGNGEIDFSEFCACIKKSQSQTKLTGDSDEIFRQCFEVFDLDRDGVITEREFKVNIITI